MWLYCLLCPNETSVFLFFMRKQSSDKLKQQYKLHQLLYISWSMKKQITHSELASYISDWPSSPAVLLRLTPSIISPSASSFSLHSDVCQHKRHCSASTGHRVTGVNRLIKAPPDSRSSTTFERLNRESHICSTSLRVQSLPPLMSSCTSESALHQRAQFHTLAWASLRPALMVWWEHRKMTEWVQVSAKSVWKVRGLSCLISVPEGRKNGKVKELKVNEWSLQYELMVVSKLLNN